MTDLDELAAALAAFQAEVPVVPKKQTARIQTERGRDYSYTYADLATIAPVVMPLLAKHGLAFTALPTGAKGDRGPVLRGMLLHSSGQRLTGELPITGRTPQEIGSSLTYGRRYLLGCLTGVVTDDDDDGQLSERAARARPRKGPAPPSPEDLPVAPPVPIQRRTRPRPVGESAPDESTPNGPPHRTPVGGAVLTPGADSTGEANPKGVTESMKRALFGAIGKALGPEAQRAERLALCAAIVGRHVDSSDDLDAREVSRILEWLERKAAGLADWSYDPYAETGYVFALDTGEVAEPWVAQEHPDHPEGES